MIFPHINSRLIRAFGGTHLRPLQINLARFHRWVACELALFWLAFGTAAASLAQTSSPPLQRIVSLAPSTTEILFAIGAGDRVVGVTRYCDYPAAAQAIAKVGGYVDPNYEAIVALQPDLVVLLTSHREPQAQLEKMRLRTVMVPHETIPDIHDAIRRLGDVCGKVEAATGVLTALSNRTLRVSQAVAGKTRLRVLVCIGRDTDSGQLTGLYAAGRNGFHDRVIELAGGQNVCADKAVAYPQLSAEGILQLNPEVIIDLVSRMNPGQPPAETITRQWAQLGTVDAVRHHRVYVIRGDHALRPGPRYIEFLEQLARLLHPEAFTGE
jgi:iron complex transport system substrate-binding protein